MVESLEIIANGIKEELSLKYPHEFMKDVPKIKILIEGIENMKNKNYLEEPKKEDKEKIDELIAEYLNQEPPKEITLLSEEELTAAKKKIVYSLKQTNKELKKDYERKKFYQQITNTFSSDSDKRDYERVAKMTKLGIKSCDLAKKLYSLQEKEELAKSNGYVSNCISLAKNIKRLEEKIGSLEKDNNKTTKYKSIEIEKLNEELSTYGNELIKNDGHLKRSQFFTQSYGRMIKDCESQKDQLEKLSCN